MSERDIDEARKGAELETGCNIDMDTAREEATWYSLMNAMALSLGSGMGIPMNGDEVNSALGKVGLCPSDLPFSNPLFVKAIYKSGDPSLLRGFDPKDFDTWRWSQDSFDRSLIPQAQGWTIIAETECAKWLNETKSTSDELRKEWMSDSLLLAALARQQCEFAFENLRNDQGLFVAISRQGSLNVVDPTTNLEDQTCMLWASSDVALLASQPGVVNDEDVRRSCVDSADALFEAISDNKDILLHASTNQVLAKSMAVPALAWYACVTDAQDLRARSLWMLRQFADDLVRAQDASETVGNSIVDAAAALRALTEAFRVTKLRTYAEAATKVFNFIESQWETFPGIYARAPFSGEYTYNADDVGMIIGALNASRLFLKDRIDRQLADLRMRVLFCKSVNMAGMQMSMPDPTMMPNWLRQREPSEHFRFHGLPLPSQAGGDFGMAPVFAGEISYDTQSDTWARNNLFDAPAAMHACCELLWLNSNVITAFPEIKLQEAPLMVREAAGIEIGREQTG